MCEWCNYKEKEWLLYESCSWSVYLAETQDYVGRCILVARRHCGSISDLHPSEWMELKDITDRLEGLCKEVLGAQVCNWSCLMNDFYKEPVPDPHLHVHMRPRYPKAVVLNGHPYPDREFGHHYALKKEDILPEADRRALFAMMKRYIDEYF